MTDTAFYSTTSGQFFLFGLFEIHFTTTSRSMTVISMADSGSTRSSRTHENRWKLVLGAFVSLGFAASNFRLLSHASRSIHTETLMGLKKLQKEIQTDYDSKKHNTSLQPREEGKNELVESKEEKSDLVFNLTQDASDSEIDELFKISEFPYPRQCHFEKPLDGHGITYDIALFYHVGMFNNWKNIMWDQLGTLEACGLGYMASSLTVSYSMSSNSSFTNPGIDELVDLFNQFTFSNTLKISYVQASAAPWKQEAIAAVSRKCHESMEPEERITDEGTQSEKRKAGNCVLLSLQGSQPFF